MRLPLQLSHSAKEGGDHDIVNAATDAHELISALRSEVSAMERHRQALQSRLDTIDLAQAASIDTRRRYDGDPHDTKHHSTQGTQDTDAGNGRAGKGATIGLEQLTRKRERAERRSRAAETLSRMVGTGERMRARGTGAGGVLASLAVAVERTSEVRRRAQQVFVGGNGMAGV